jgi:hypothetical protein
MNEFKVGDEIVRASDFGRHAPEGYTCKVVGGHMYTDKDGELGLIYDWQWELAKPKWTIYNNTLPWSELSDKQKGKMLLAQNNKLKFESFTSSGPTMPFSKGWVYVVEKPEPVKPEPTMAELFKKDWYDCLRVDGKYEQQMIAKGWVKK